MVGWGETYGIVAPRATMEIITDLLAAFVVGRDPFDVSAIHDDLYNLMRVRGYTGGYYLDALAAIDIALWDIAGRSRGCRFASCSAAAAGAHPGLCLRLAETHAERARGARRGMAAEGLRQLQIRVSGGG